jgi:hypothetical protein
MLKKTEPAKSISPGKSYYLAGAFPLWTAAGGVYWELKILFIINQNNLKDFM